MNEHLQAYAKEQILANLTKLKPECHRLFKLMYGRNRGKRSVEDAEAMSIEDVLKEIPADKLDWCMSQTIESLKKPKLLAPCTAS